MQAYNVPSMEAYLLRPRVTSEGSRSVVDRRRPVRTPQREVLVNAASAKVVGRRLHRPAAVLRPSPPPAGYKCVVYISPDIVRQFTVVTVMYLSLYVAAFNDRLAGRPFSRFR